MNLQVKTTQKKALFLDRDGIINVDNGYVYRIEDFEFIDGIFNVTRQFYQLGYLIFVVTNQSGIGRGFYSELDFNNTSKWMVERFKLRNIKIEHVYHCPHTPQEHCSCRKPATGMIKQAKERYDIDLKHSWMIGDKQSDMDFARNAHIANSIYIGCNNSVHHFSYSFESIRACQIYLTKNQDIILP